MLLETPRIGGALVLAGLLFTGGCASWQKCENETVPKWAQPTIGHNGPPDWGAGSLVVGGLVMGVCVAVIQTKTAIDQRSDPSPPQESNSPDELTGPKVPSEEGRTDENSTDR